MTTDTAAAQPRTVTAARTTRRGRTGLGRRVRRGYLWLLAPAFVFMGVFFAYPLGYGVVISLSDFTAATFISGDAPFVGFDNFVGVMSSPLFAVALRNTLLVTVCSLAGQLAGGMALALYFERRFPGHTWMPSVILVSWLIPLVITATTWRWILQENGAFNQVLGLAGIDGPAWLSEPSLAIWAVIGVNIWAGLPFTATILSSSLRGVPLELHEAAVLDGAGYWRRVWSITLPQLRPVISVLVVLGIVGTLKLLDLVLVLTGGGPANSTQTFAMLSYIRSFREFDFGAGAALGNILLAITVVFAVVYARATRGEQRG
jgi:multiple sugar transport system permease protein